MILTYKIKHSQDFSQALNQARKIAKFAIANRDRLSTKFVKHIGLKSSIANQILRKYGRNTKCTKVKSIKLIVPNQSIKFFNKIIEIPCLKLQFNFDKPCIKINQIEIDTEYYYVSVLMRDEPLYEAREWLGVDRNTTKHCVVAACTKTNKVLFLGKKSQHIHEKYKHIRKRLQRLNKPRKLVAIKRRESRIQRDLNHKVSHKLVTYAKQHQCGIKMEDLEGIRQRTKQAKSFKYSLNSWAYYQLQQFVEYKAQLAGVPVAYCAPHYTSQLCHRCGLLGKRNGKAFECPHCGHTSHADINAAWNIAYRKPIHCPEFCQKLLKEPNPEPCQVSGFSSDKLGVYIQQLKQEGDCFKGNTDIPQRAML
jgi:putative transposase